jgi:glycosyltransferase involved in cell wall biosynthesis
MINVLYDARFITRRRTGVGRVAEMLLRSLLNANDSNLNIHVLYREPLDKSLLGNNALCVKTPFDSHPAGDFFRNISLRRMIKKRRIDLYFSPAFYSIQLAQYIPQVTLIHDLAVFDQPDSISPLFRVYLRRMIRSTIRNATCITTPSRFIRERIKHHFPNAKKDLRAIHLGVDPIFSHYNDASAESMRDHYCLPSHFCLSVVTVEPRKNLLALLDAYAIYIGRAAKPVPLVIVGDDGFRAREVHDRAEKPDLSPHVRFLGYLPDDELALLLGMSECLLYPSLYEGFGLPVVEAMAAGCPVITSNVASMPEIASDAAMLVNPREPLEIEQALRLMTGSASLRRRFSIAGRERVRAMTWNKTAAAYIEVFHHTMDTHVGRRS